jgi:hypothetical protein
VQVHHDEGVANRIDPESCANTREGIGAALTGERIGQPLSRESTLIPGADVVPVTEGNADGRDNPSAQTARRGLRHWHVRTLFAREPGDLMVGQRQLLHWPAELVEPRARAEENASQQSTGRAQYRGTVSQALKRMRNLVRISRRAVTHPRWEPYALIGLVRICAGGAR